MSRLYWLRHLRASKVTLGQVTTDFTC